MSRSRPSVRVCRVVGPQQIECLCFQDLSWIRFSLRGQRSRSRSRSRSRLRSIFRSSSSSKSRSSSRIPPDLSLYTASSRLLHHCLPCLLRTGLLLDHQVQSVSFPQVVGAQEGALLKELGVRRNGTGTCRAFPLWSSLWSLGLMDSWAFTSSWVFGVRGLYTASP